MTMDGSSPHNKVQTPAQHTVIVRCRGKDYTEPGAWPKGGPPSTSRFSYMMMTEAEGVCKSRPL